MAKDNVIALLRELRGYACGKGVKAMFSWHSEDSRLVRYANSSVSLNTEERISQLSVTVFGDHRKASSNVIASADDLSAMKDAVDKAAEMLPFAAPLSYLPQISCIPETICSEEGYDPKLASLTSEDMIAFVEQAVRGLETDDILLSGNVSTGVLEEAEMSTESPEAIYWRNCDAGISLVLASRRDKWEVNAEQSAATEDDLDAEALYDRLSWLVGQYTSVPGARVPEGTYRVVFGPAALATYVNYLAWIGYSGGAMKRGSGMLKSSDVGKQILSEQFTLTEDPALQKTFPRPADAYGRRRARLPLFEKGVFGGFIWGQSEADEFGEEATGHDVSALSIEMKGGTRPEKTIQELAALPRDTDVLYIPYLHYTGLVNPSEGLVTGTSRFGALWLKKDGTIAVPYNVRFTQSLKDVFGRKLRWLSQTTVPYGESTFYGSRNPEAVVVPALACVDDVRIEISNKSF